MFAQSRSANLALSRMVRRRLLRSNVLFAVKEDMKALDTLVPFAFLPALCFRRFQFLRDGRRTSSYAGGSTMRRLAAGQKTMRHEQEMRINDRRAQQGVLIPGSGIADSAVPASKVNRSE